MSEARPNFLIICTDQMRADHMGCAGNPVIRTPNLDAMATQGILLQRAYVNCPLCTPSRSSLFTGLSPRGHLVRTNGIPLDPAIPTVPGALADAGYQTASIGKVHLSPYWLNPEATSPDRSPAAFPELMEHWQAGRIESIPVPYYGLQHVEITIGHGSGVQGDYALWLQREHPEEWERLRSQSPVPSPLGAENCGTYALEERYHHTAYVADRTMEYLRRNQGTKPFFLICSFPDPHHPYHVPSPWDTMYEPGEVVPPVWREGELDDLAPFFRQIWERPILLSGRVRPTKMPLEQQREILAYTYGMVSQVDRHVGRILDVLAALELSDNTVVVFISDHGDMMGDHGMLNKGPFHFEGLLRVPMIWRWPGHITGQSSSALVSLLDLPPTILDLAGVPIPEGPTSPEALQQPPAWPGRSLVPLLTGREETVQNSVVIENDEDYQGFRVRTLITPTHKITTYTGHRSPEPFGELFDLTDDPDELHNLWDSPAHRTLRLRLIEQLHYRLVETDMALPRRQGHA